MRHSSSLRPGLHHHPRPTEPQCLAIPPRDLDTIRGFGLRYMLLALRAIDENIAQGRHLYESAQAIASLATYYYGEARWLDGWAAFGQLRRLIVPLGLHMPPNEASGESDGNRQSRPVGRMVLLFDAVDDVEREEGRAHLWTAVIWDATQASNSGMPGRLPVDGIVRCLSCLGIRSPPHQGVLLPCDEAAFKRSECQCPRESVREIESRPLADRRGPTEFSMTSGWRSLPMVNPAL